jgi:cytochrome c-type biogenesis protein CcsB
MKKWLPILVTAAMAAWFLNTLRPPADQTFAYSEFGKLPVVFNGRVQPLDSLARNSLLQIREKQEANLEPWKGDTEKPKLISATEWLAAVMMDPATSDQWPVFRVDNPDVISLLKLPAKDLAQHHDGKHYSWAEIQPGLHALQNETDRISDEKKDSSQQTAYEKAAMKMRERLLLYVQLKNTLQPEDGDLKSVIEKLQSAYPAEAAALPAFGEMLASYDELRRDRESGASVERKIASTQAAVEKFLSVAKTTQAGKPYSKDDLAVLLEQVERLQAMVSMDPPLVIPPSEAGLSHDAWKGVGVTLTNDLRTATINPFVRDYAAISTAFAAGDATEFNKQVAAYRTALAPNFPRELSKAGAEVFFNRMQPFYNAMVIYVLAGVLVLLFWVNLSETLRRTAVWLIGLALIIHTTGLVFRMVLEGRPPVTNLYSSAIFIGFGAVVLGMILERFHKNGIGAVVASGIGFITLIIAHHLALTGDTMEMMRAVLDTNFWLATHVVVVTLGYASTFVAGFLGVVYVCLGFFTNRLTTVLSTDQAKIGRAAAGGDSFGKTLTRMIYGIVCFATLFSFVGTVLGGIWADQSWGRFWGWDPKENGALIIVLWNALILHLRWGGMIRERGLAACAVVGNIVTSWSWFGVNMLGIGLHSYGFMDAAFWWLIAFDLSQVGLFVLACLPLSMWRSFQGSHQDNPPSPGPVKPVPAV